MFNKVDLINFKSFSNLSFDFTQKNNKSPKNLIAIYGENGSGKTNVVDAFKILKLSTLTTQFADVYTTLQSLTSGENMDSEDLPFSMENFQKMVQAARYRELKPVLSNSSRIGTDENTKLEFHFTIRGVNGSYALEYDKNYKLVSESLYYLINKRRGILFSIKKEKENIDVYLNKNSFLLASQRRELEELNSKLWGKHTFISIFNQYQDKVNEQFVNKNVTNHLLDVIDEFNKLIIWDDEIKGPFVDNGTLLADMEKGTINKEQLPQLKKCEEVIYNYFSSLYADIKDVRYKLKEEGNVINYQLYIHKNISNELVEIPFYLESNGTKNLLSLLTAFFWVTKGNTVIIDEIDSGIHDILMNQIIRDISSDIKGQLLFTTHDTFLLRELPTSSIYFINIDIMGNKRILSANDFDRKVSVNNNIQNMYLNGDFNAIPDPLDMDFKALFEPFDENELEV